MTSQGWQQVTNTQQKVLFLIAVIFLTVAFFRGFYRPRQANLRVRQGQLQGIKLERDSLKKVMELSLDFPVVTKKPSSDDIKLKVLNGDVEPLPLRTMPDLLKELTLPHFLRGLEVVSVHDKPSKKEEGYELFSSVLTMRGPFFSVSSFIERLERLPLLLKVTDLSVKMVEKGNPEVQTELILELYQMRGGGA